MNRLAIGVRYSPTPRPCSDAHHARRCARADSRPAVAVTRFRDAWHPPDCYPQPAFSGGKRFGVSGLSARAYRAQWWSQRRKSAQALQSVGDELIERCDQYSEQWAVCVRSCAKLSQRSWAGRPAIDPSFPDLSMIAWPRAARETGS